MYIINHNKQENRRSTHTEPASGTQPLSYTRCSAMDVAHQRAQAYQTSMFALKTRVYSDGLSKDRKQSLLSWLVAVTTLTIYTGWMHILLGLLLGSFFSCTCLYLLLATWATVYLPAKPVLWRRFAGCWVFKTWREYFKFSYLSTACQACWPNWRIFSLAASSIYHIPFWRHFLTWVGCVPASSSNFKQMLREGSVGPIVGGIAEMYMKHPHKERIVLRNRKGFVRIALETGVDGIVPVYHFGNTQVFDFWPQSLRDFARKWRVGIGLLVGRWGTPIPRQVPLFQVTGCPIPVPKVDVNDTDKFAAAVDELHARVVAEVQGLYDRHKASYGWGDRPLSIE